MHKPKYKMSMIVCLCLCVFGVIALILQGATIYWLYRLHHPVLSVSSKLDSTYSHWIHKNFYEPPRIQVFDNVLYYLDQEIEGDSIRQVKDGEDTLFCKLTTGFDLDFYRNWKFAVCDGRAYVEYAGIADEAIYRMTKWGKDKLIVKGHLIGAWAEMLYYGVYYDGIWKICAYNTANEMHAEVLSCDKIYAEYADGFVYHIGEKVYYYAYDDPDRSRLLCEGDPERFFPKRSLMLGEVLYWEDKIVHLTMQDVEIYHTDTGGYEVIELNDENHDRTICINHDALFVSMRKIDAYFYPEHNIGYNGTWRYSFADGSWTKLSDKYFVELLQFDDRYLYGVTELTSRIQLIDLQ